MGMHNRQSNNAFIPTSDLSQLDALIISMDIR